jgi:hydroxypyruvate reductase/glycerate 2-kinase
MTPPDVLRDHALAIWTAAVDAVRPEPLVADAVRRLPADWRAALDAAPRVLVVGCGKAGAAMAAGLEHALADRLPALVGLVNVPEGSTRPLRRVRLHPARPAGSNYPTAAGAEGAEEMLRLLAGAGPDDVALCLLSGGGSALLPAPADGITLDDKQAVTKLLHRCGATIGEMNAVRKHLSRVKGGRLAEAFGGRLLVGLVISDVVGDPLDVIASGPTTPDPTTFADALAVLDRYSLLGAVPPAVRGLLERGAAGLIPETPKRLPDGVHNVVVGNNATALAAASAKAESLGYRVLNLGPFVEGESREVAVALAGVVRAVRALGVPTPPPVCLLVGGETTVALGDRPGQGGRNQEFVLAAAARLGAEGMGGACVLSGGTDGEDGPTDAAGAVATADTLRVAAELGLDPRPFLDGHDSYRFFDRTGGLIRTGLTDTNVTDVRVILVG